MARKLKGENISVKCPKCHWIETYVDGKLMSSDQLGVGADQFQVYAGDDVFEANGLYSLEV